MVDKRGKFMNIYVMRHGTTNWNEKRIHQGRSQNRLSKAGKELAEKVALENKNLKIDVIYVSPLMRTIQTAKIMNQYHNVKMIKDERLIEIDQGIFTRRKMNSLTEEEIKLRDSRSPSCKMESYESVYSRIKNFVEDIKQNEKNKNILIVTHKYCSSYLELALTNQNPNHNNPAQRELFKNAELKKFVI